ncbi:ABC transporter substrate-binding protein [Acidaminobacter sp. JC074]|uniref:ABC transporter substrate-binding protein n=1 Tax=Acidaminobacter sp. JC074 TaxID=2530199 RepID=UPI001F0D61D4|nr:ABC transporter substrate-binding protein [Acidaminobacter sp. JC074]MCH4891372.1 ABC transporter substrate-binding protein [Acidaminobacter sp. JC074]
MVAGCSQQESTIPAPTEESIETVEETQEIVELNYYSHPDEKGERNAIIKAFEELHPNVKVNLIELPPDTSEKLTMISKVLQAEDTAMDIFDADVIWPSIFAAAGWVEPLDNYMTEEEIDAHLPGAMYANLYQGHYYGIPYRTDTGMLYYRKDLLEKYNKSVPTTWDELVQTAEYIMSKEGGDMTGYAGSWKQFEGLTCNLMEFVWSYGGDVLDEDSKVVFDSPESVAAVTRMVDMINAENITPEGVITFSSGDARDVFFSGNMVFLRDWPSGWSKSQDPENSKIVDKVGIAALPTGGEGNESYSTLGGWQVMVSAFSEHKEEAVAFAKFRASEYSQILMSKELSHIPSLKTLYSNEEVLEAMPFLEDMYPAIIHAYPRPKSPYYAELSNILQVELQNAFKEHKTPEEAVKSASDQIKTLLGQ